MRPPTETGERTLPRGRGRTLLRAAYPLLLGAAAFVVIRGTLPGRYDSGYSRADYDRAVRELRESTRASARYDALAAAAKTSVYFGSLDDARAYATELLDLARTTRPTWNLGNALHDGHEVLGLVALRQGRPEDARRELLAAGDTPGSPQLDSFGPNMLLAKELIERREVDAVVEYFAKCRRFWEMERGRLEQWTKDAREGRDPDFGANLVF